MSKRRLISFDWALKRLLRSKANYEVLEGFVSELLKQDIKILDILESESNKETVQDKFNRLDLKVKNQAGELILIELQYEREFDYLQRILYATSKAIVEHLAEGQNYAEIVKVISINILYFDLGQGQDYIYHGKTNFVGIHYQDALQLSLKQQDLFAKQHPYQLYPEYYLLKINQFDDIAKDTLDEWIYFLKHEEIKENFTAKGLQKAKQVLDVLQLSNAERRAYESYVEDLHYQASMYLSSFGVGKLEGRAEGEHIGEKRNKMNTAHLMLQAGESIEKIMLYTELSREEIEHLKETL